MALGKNIRNLREAQGLTLERLSELSGVDVGTISALEVRDSSRSKYAHAIAKGLGVSLEDLLSEAPAVGAGRKVEEMYKSNVVALKRPPDEILISQYNTGGAMGHGLELRDQPGIIQSWRVNPEWLERNVRAHSSAKNLCIVTGFGDSMQPLFNPGDPLLVDIGIRTVEFDSIYFFRVGNDGYVKRLQRIPTEKGLVIRARSENEAYETFDITESMDFEILGRVLKVWRSYDF